MLLHIDGKGKLNADGMIELIKERIELYRFAPWNPERTTPKVDAPGTFSEKVFFSWGTDYDESMQPGDEVDDISYVEYFLSIDGHMTPEVAKLRVVPFNNRYALKLVNIAAG